MKLFRGLKLQNPINDIPTFGIRRPFKRKKIAISKDASALYQRYYLTSGRRDN